MSTALVRGASTAAALTVLLATSAAAASASPTRVKNQGFVDVSSNGRYVLTSDGAITDRTTDSTVLPIGTGSPLDLANDAPISLESASGAGLVVRSPANPDGTFVSIGPSGTGVPISGTARLVRNGTAVIFATTERPTRIIERDLTTGTSTVRLTGATLLDASEDGKVITWQRSTGEITRPAGSAPIPGDPTAGTTGVAVGYQVAGAEPRVVDVTHYAQQRLGNPSTTCPEQVGANVTTPVSLDVSQDGAAARYTLVLGTAFKSAWYPFTSHQYSRLTSSGDPLVIATDDTQTSVAHVTTDPVSGAYTVVTDNHGSYPTYNVAKVVGDDGTSHALAIAPTDTPNTAALFTTAAPFARGAGAAFTAIPAVGTQSGTWLDDGFGAVGTSTTPWLGLPREGDAVDSAATKADTAFISCGVVTAPVAGTIADYAPLTVKTTGNSAGSIAFTKAPAGKIAAKSLTVSVSWFGLQLSTRTTTTDGTVTLPAIVPGVSGFKATERVTLTNGTVVSASTALRRTR